MTQTTLAVATARWAVLIMLLLEPLTARAEACEGAPSAARLLVVVEGVRSDQGLMTASLYPNDRDKFLVRYGALKVWRVPARAPQTRMCIWMKGPGTYAVAIYHDANANYKLDRNLFGPTEGYGFSNNPHIAFAAPPLDAVTFQAGAGDTTVHVRLHYP
ncbi:MAG TPA: DUF2141 domain-containing protein [Caulobacteraceae bacterium]